jgi:hypothetical protein
MDKAVSINRKKFLGAYIDAPNGNHIPEDAYFCAGVFLSVLLPQLTFVAYGGILPLVVFALTAAAGSACGLAKYRSALRPMSCVVLGAEARVPPHWDASQKRAA